MAVPFLQPGADTEGTMEARSALRTAQVIAAALIFGEVVFAVIVGVVAFTQGNGLWPAPPAPGAPAIFGMDQMAILIPGIAMLMALATVPMAFVLRAQMLRKGTDPRTGAVGAEAFIGAVITSLALLEGFGLLGLVGGLLSKSLMPGAIPAAVSIAMILVMFPRESTLRGRGGGGAPYREAERWK